MMSGDSEERRRRYIDQWQHYYLVSRKHMHPWGVPERDESEKPPEDAQADQPRCGSDEAD